MRIASLNASPLGKPQPLDHLIGERKQIVRDFDPERLGGLDFDYELKLGRLQNWQIGGFGTVENFA